MAALPTNILRSFAVVAATDAPLIPRQLENLAGRAALGLARVGVLDAATGEGLVLAVSMTGLDDAAGAGSSPTRPVSLVADMALPGLYEAAAEACEEAVLNGMLQAAPFTGTAADEAVAVRTLPADGWPEDVRRFQSSRRDRG